MNTQRETPPNIEPLTVAEAKASPALRIDGAIDDAYIGALITAARQECEQATGRTLITTTWEALLEAFPTAGIRLPWPNVQAITHIKWNDGTTLQTLAPSAYALDATLQPPTVVLAPGNAWPNVASVANAVQVRYTAGFDNPADADSARRAAVPAALRVWLQLRTAQLYLGCDAAEGVAMANHPLLWPYKVYP